MDVGVRMANTQKYINHLLQNTGITPACSEEEHETAELIANIFRRHGFDPEIQEFNASASTKVVQAVYGILVFVGALLLGTGGLLGAIGLLLVLAVGAVYTVERMGRPIFSQLGAGGLSQNVIAYHKASGPLASPRNRPVVVVAHYDSPRADFMCQQPFSDYRPLMVKAMPACMVAPFVLGVVRLLPFPSGIKTVLWIVAILAALVPLVNAVGIIANRLVLPYTSGSVCNKSSVAAMLGVMDEVAPFGGSEEFPGDVPFDTYFSEQVRMAEEAAAAAEAERQAREAAKLAKRNGGAAADQVEDEETPVDGGDAVEFVEVADETAAFGEVGEAEQTAASDVEDQIFETEVGEDEAEAAPEPAPEVAPESEAEAEPVPEPEPAAEPLVYPLVNDAGNIRFGADIVKSLGMLPESCSIVYEETPRKAVESQDAQEPAALAEDGAVASDQFDEGMDWDAEPEPFETLDYYDEDLEYDVEPEATVAERLRDGASRLIDFVRTKAGQLKERNSAEVEDEEAFEGAEDADGADPALDEDLVFEDGAEIDATAVAEPVEESGAEQGAELEVEKTLERTAVVATEPDAEAVPVDDTVVDERVASAQPVETVDSLMAEISAASAPAPARAVAPRILNVPSTVDAPAPQTSSSASRAALFDLPDPSAAPVDPFAASDAQQAAPGAAGASASGQQDDSLSSWLGVDSDFDAKRSGREIGSWANFEDDSSWKGGASSADGASEAELRGAIASMGDDELLGHDIWFVAAGASENGNAGIEAFLRDHRDKLRGVFLINLECVGAGQVAMVATEGRERVLKGDRRIMGLVSRVSADFHHEFGSVEMPHLYTDAYTAMNMSLRSLTIAGVDGNGFALSHSEEDQPYNVDAENIDIVADVVTEVIRRS